MTQEEKILLLQDLCARLPYGVVVHFEGWNPEKLTQIDLRELVFNDMGGIPIPYLRPLSSMSDEEYQEFNDIRTEHALKCLELSDKESFELGMRLQQEEMSYLYQRHYDINNLIPKGLAIEAPEGMYNN